MMLLRLGASLVLASAAGGGCDVGLAERLRWAFETHASLESQGYDVTAASLKYAPIGTISDPAGTYGGVLDLGDAAFPGVDGDFAKCLGNDVGVAPQCALLEKAIFTSNGRESASRNSYVLKEDDAIVFISCSPPKSGYFGLQTNVLSRWATTSSGDTGLFYPQAAPYDSMNHLVLNTTHRRSAGDSFESAFVVVSTASKSTLASVQKALTRAGVPEDAVNVDALASPSVKLWSGGDWREDLPDALQMIARINAPKDSKAVEDFITESQLGVHRVLLVRGKGNASKEDALHAPPWRKRRFTDASLKKTYDPVLDSVVAGVVSAAEKQGFHMTYYGDMITTMRFGYEQNFPDGPSDVDECCLVFPSPDGSHVHYSTSDCLYENAGAGFGPTSMGTPRNVSLDACGEPPLIDSFFQLTCLNGTLRQASPCPEPTCGICKGSDDADPKRFPQTCTANGTEHFRYACVDGDAVRQSYADAQCASAPTTAPAGECAFEASTVPSPAAWASAYLRGGGIAVAVGVMSNSIGESTFHDVYVPLPGTYNDPDGQLHFDEEDLNGSARPWVAPGAAAEVDHLFVAQWGRSCISAPGLAKGAFCYELNSTALANDSAYSYIVRHYLDPETKTGPSEQALPRHRVLVFDPAPSPRS
ncbi:hypothetical protein M885DRAFT_610209 [Pelagophyceae sp. CCMP2097]|nr:hypothetical protein M885DRAFT_610209 [Pelagophyceae sp. CCMP2097]